MNTKNAIRALNAGLAQAVHAVRRRDVDPYEEYEPPLLTPHAWNARQRLVASMLRLAADVNWDPNTIEPDDAPFNRALTDYAVETTRKTASTSSGTDHDAWAAAYDDIQDAALRAAYTQWRSIHTGTIAAEISHADAMVRLDSALNGYVQAVMG